MIGGAASTAPGRPARLRASSSVALGLTQCKIELVADLHDDAAQAHARLLQPFPWAVAASVLLDVRALDLPRLRSRVATHETEFARARREYTDWVLAEQRDALLHDPVVTVNADALSLEAASSDGRAYAAVRVHGGALDHLKAPTVGTTTCACPSRFHRALGQVRPYRATEIIVAPPDGAAPMARAEAARAIGTSTAWRRGFARTQFALACVAHGGSEEWVGPVVLTPTDLLLLSRALARRTGKCRTTLVLSPEGRARLMRDGEDDVALPQARWHGAPGSARLWGRDAWSALAPLAGVSTRARVWIARAGAFVCLVDCGDVDFTLSYAGSTGEAPRREAHDAAAVEEALGELGACDVARLEERTGLSAVTVRTALEALAVGGRVSVEVGSGRWRRRRFRPAVSSS